MPFGFGAGLELQHFRFGGALLLHGARRFASSTCASARPAAAASAVAASASIFLRGGIFDAAGSSASAMISFCCGVALGRFLFGFGVAHGGEHILSAAQFRGLLRASAALMSRMSTDSASFSAAVTATFFSRSAAANASVSLMRCCSMHHGLFDFEPLANDVLDEPSALSSTAFCLAICAERHEALALGLLRARDPSPRAPSRRHRCAPCCAGRR